MSTVTDMLNMTCTIGRRTASISAATFGQEGGYSSAYLAVPCTVQRIGGAAVAEIGYGGKLTATMEYAVYFEGGVDIRASDRIDTIASNDGTTPYTGVILYVTGGPMDDAGFAAYTRVTAEQRVGGGGL